MVERAYLPTSYFHHCLSLPSSVRIEGGALIVHSTCSFDRSLYMNGLACTAVFSPSFAK